MCVRRGLGEESTFLMYVGHFLWKSCIGYQIFFDILLYVKSYQGKQNISIFALNSSWFDFIMKVRKLINNTWGHVRKVRYAALRLHAFRFQRRGKGRQIQSNLPCPSFPTPFCCLSKGPQFPPSHGTSIAFNSITIALKKIFSTFPLLSPNERRDLFILFNFVSPVPCTGLSS